MILEFSWLNFFRDAQREFQFATQFFAIWQVQLVLAVSPGQFRRSVGFRNLEKFKHVGIPLIESLMCLSVVSVFPHSVRLASETRVWNAGLSRCRFRSFSRRLR